MQDSRINEWFNSNTDLVLGDIEKGYKKDRYSEENVLDILKMFNYDESIYYIASSLFEKLSNEIIHECYIKNITYDQCQKEMIQLCKFCCFEEYGRELSVEDFYELVYWEEIRELLGG